jgi:hypothetical protein
MHVIPASLLSQQSGYSNTSKIYNPVFCIKYIKSAKTLLFRIVYTHLCIKLDRNWVTGFLAMPRLGRKLGSAEVYSRYSIDAPLVPSITDIQSFKMIR